MSDCDRPCSRLTAAFQLVLTQFGAAWVHWSKRAIERHMPLVSLRLLLRLSHKFTSLFLSIRPTDLLLRLSLKSILLFSYVRLFTCMSPVCVYSCTAICRILSFFTLTFNRFYQCSAYPVKFETINYLSSFIGSQVQMLTDFSHPLWQLSTCVDATMPNACHYAVSHLAVGLTVCVC